jgi:hypothetical protein
MLGCGVVACWPVAGWFVVANYVIAAGLDPIDMRPCLLSLAVLALFVAWVLYEFSLSIYKF